MKRIIMFCFLAIIITAVSNAEEKELRKITIANFASLSEGHKFWESQKAFMKAVCRDLNIELYYKYCDNNPFLAYELLGKATVKDKDGKRLVDAVIIPNFKQQGENFIKIMDKNEVPGIISSGADYSVSGKPREKHKFFIGETVMDEENIGYNLAITLINEAEKMKLNSKDGKIHMIAISGGEESALSKKRVIGLEKAVRERTNVVLEQIFPAKNWSTEEGEEKFLGAIIRYPEATVVWSANDDIAMGVIKGAKSKGIKPGKEMIIGGIDWTNDAVKAIKSEELTASYGGLAFHGGWAAIILYDYLNGIDFKNGPGVTIETKGEILDKSNVDEYIKNFGDGNWDKVDFRKFSKKYNPKLKKYDFSLKKIIENME